ncbi:ATP-binding cassette domain-containing protein [Neobittarella massiliensis]|uniref:ATP-binding cassette domain-containing protein n=1 Tax=Neobittarella massiliensis (ex Bilen et al. 2018) TaxID=2041842 RepID=A0A8J6IKF1_9FIRM|nr:ABC transporter A family member [Neobittarella massiliensis]MBC3516221.1 ATP-binding cassette domain-containing protein [Neobittarella massiliensis]
MEAIKTAALTKRYRQALAVDRLSLTVFPGELFSLLGVNGAGKTTTIKMLCGLTAPTGGNAWLLGDSIVEHPQRAKQKLGLSPQETAVAPNLTVAENLQMMARIYGADSAQAAARTGDILCRLSLQPVQKSLAKTLSGGMQRRLSIGMALISGPQILFLDEPTLGLDVLARRQLWALIQSLKGSVTVVLTTHYMEEAQTLSDRIGIMAGGRLTAVGTPGQLMAQTGTTRFEDAFVALAAPEEVAI